MMEGLNKAFQEAMKRNGLAAYDGRAFMDLRQMFYEGYMLSQQDQEVVEKDERQLELF